MTQSDPLLAEVMHLLASLPDNSVYALWAATQRKPSPFGQLIASAIENEMDERRTDD